MKQKMRQKMKSLTAMLMVVIMLLSCVPQTAFSAITSTDKPYVSSEKAVHISAESDDTVEVVGKHTEDDSTIDNGPLSITIKSYNIERDYEQECMIGVKNTGDESVEFYMESPASYDDLSYEIIKSGSTSEPMVLNPGESAQVELSIFAQNACSEKYEIPIVTYMKVNGEFSEYSRNEATIHCNIPKLDITWEKISEDKTTLSQKYRITNTGDKLTDIALSASDSLLSYLSFAPIISNYELESNESVEFTVQPDLAKMKENNVSKLTGYLSVECAGKTSKMDCTFDTEGQEITITTLGELARKQNGNPFTDFDVDESSIALSYYDGTQYVPITEDTTREELFSDDENLNIHFDSTVNLGGDNSVDFGIGLKTYPYTNESSEDLKPQVVENDGNYHIVDKIVLTREEYEEFLATLSDSSKVFASAFKAQALDDKKDPVEQGERFILDVTFDINTVASFVDKDSSYLGFLGCLYDVATEIDECDKVSSNPSIDKDTRDLYYALAVAKCILSLSSEVVGSVGIPGKVFFGLAWVAGKLIDHCQELLLEKGEDPNAIYSQVSGLQCTNRGKVSAKFYVPNYNKQPGMYTTNRMNADGYVNNDHTKYDILLNGEKVGETYNEGLTDVNMAKIPTDRLIPGETNEVVFDYDTNPGSHYVSTDVRITLLYPSDTEVGYIGNPENLQEVRALPDFTIYTNNIKTDAKIIGLKSALTFDVYNIGCHSGWCNVKAYEGSKLIFEKESCYIDAFSSELFTTEWTPTSIDNDIRVEVTNISVGLDEKDSSNNSASKSIKVRDYKTPVISNLYAGNVYENESFYLTADLLSDDDVKSINFAVDGKSVESPIESRTVSGGHRHYVNVTSGVSLGEHEFTVTVLYANKDGEAKLSETILFEIREKEYMVPIIDVYNDTLLYGDSFEFEVSQADDHLRTTIQIDDGEESLLTTKNHGSDWKYYVLDVNDWNRGVHQVKIRAYYPKKEGEACTLKTVQLNLVSKADSEFAFTLGDDITNQSFYIYEFDDEYYYSADYSKEDDKYSIRKTPDMYLHPENYMLVVTCKSGLICKAFTENNANITLKDCNKLVVNCEENDYISQIRVRDINGLYASFYVPVVNNTIYMTANIYQVEINGYVYDDIYAYSTIDVNLSSGDMSVNLRDLVKRYRFKVEGTDVQSFSAKIYYYDGYWNSHYLSTSYDSSTNIISCFLASDYYIKKVQASEEVRIVLYNDNETYLIQIKAPSKVRAMALANDADDDIILVSKDSLHKVTLICADESNSVEYSEVDGNDFQVNLSGAEIYLPEGDYTLRVTVNIGNQRVYSRVSINVPNDQEVIVDQEINEKYAPIKIQWADQFEEEADVICYSSNSSSTYAYGLKNGSEIKVPIGKSNEFDICLSQNNSSFDIERYLDVEKTNDPLMIDSEFSGSINLPNGSYNPSTEIYISLQNVVDKYGNRLYDCDSYYNDLYANVTFTDIDDANNTFVYKYQIDDESFYAQLPEKAGKYKVKVDIFSFVLNENDEHEHDIVTDQGKEATCTEGGLTEGLHCSTCGEVIQPQKNTQPLGHDWDTGHEDKEPTCAEDGSKVYTCQRCSETRTEIIDKLHHVYKNGKCILCGEDDPSLNPVVPVDPVDPADPTDPTDHTEHIAGNPVKENVVKANCTKKGSYESVTYCQICGQELSRKVVKTKALGHKAANAVKEKVIKATCTKKGSYESVTYCKTCHAELSRIKKTTASLGHSWNKGVIVKKPTYTATGKKVYTCKRCGKMKNVVLGKLPRISIANWKIKVSQSKKNGFVVKVYSNDKKIASKYYTLSYGKLVKGKKVTITVKGKGKYTGTIKKKVLVKI